MKNNSLDNVNSLNNILCNMKIGYNKTSYFIAFSTGMLSIIKMFLSF